ncbi:MAG: ISAs1 family transposase [Sphaerochaetaceae bacterium]|nr:ISAs1 family transposase [Sphaerochaetaceae bacterium]
MTEFSTMKIAMEDFLSTSTMTVKSMGGPAQMRVCRKLLKIFDDIPDRRVEGRTAYRMSELVLMLFLATLSGCDTCTETALFWKAQAKTYRKLFSREEIPSHDTFRRILGLIGSDGFNSTLVSVLTDSDASIRKAMGLPKPGRTIFSVDGKQLRGTGRTSSKDGEKKDLQILKVYESSTGTCLYSDAIEEKTNEIPHARKLLGGMDLKNAVVTFGALHTNAETIGGDRKSQRRLRRRAEGEPGQAEWIRGFIVQR